MRRICAATLLCLAGFGLCTSVGADGPEARVSHVWIRQAPPGINSLAGYFVLDNLTHRPLTLVNVTSDDFDSVMMHETVSQNGMDSMRPVERIMIPANKSVTFAPGSYHLMLMNPHRNFGIGDMVALTLIFSDQSALTILAPVRRDAPQD